MGWPLKPVEGGTIDQKDFDRFYPAHLMETGYDILFFWVARMVRMYILCMYIYIRIVILFYKLDICIYMRVYV